MAFSPICGAEHCAAECGAHQHCSADGAYVCDDGWGGAACDLECDPGITSCWDTPSMECCSTWCSAHSASESCIGTCGGSTFCAERTTGGDAYNAISGENYCSCGLCPGTDWRASRSLCDSRVHICARSGDIFSRLVFYPHSWYKQNTWVRQQFTSHKIRTLAALNLVSSNIFQMCTAVRT